MSCGPAAPSPGSSSPSPRIRSHAAVWKAYVRGGLPLAGRLISPSWAEVGGFLAGSVTGFWREWPLDRLLGAWRAAGIEDVGYRRLSFGGGIVIWGRRS